MEKKQKISVDAVVTKLKGFKAVDWVMWLGIAGMLLILLSSFQKGGGQRSKTVQPSVSYETLLEQRLGEVVGSISGVGKAKIMVTLEKSAEKVYAKEIKDNTDKTEDYSGEQLQAVQQKVNNEVKYILVEGSSGKKEALVTAELEPAIKGVVIVCEGADSPKVVNNVLEAVTTALDIPSSRVCVTKLG